MEHKISGTPPDILIVEDSLVEAELLRRVLFKAGYRVTVAKNGEEGLLALNKQAYALVISDIQMPLMDGYRLCREIKHDKKLWHIPVILTSVLSEPEDIIEALNVGADSYLTKPFVEANLLNRIHSLMVSATGGKLAEAEHAEQVEYNGKQHTINANSRQLLNLLLSVYENTLSQNRELIETHNQLNLLNDNLEAQVKERTTALRQSEEQVSKIAESAQDAIIMMGADQRISFWNAAAERIFGFTAIEAIGRELHTLIVPAQAYAKFKQGFSNFQSTGSGPIVGKMLELTALRKGGEEFPVELSVAATPFHSQWHAIGVVRDISERKKAEAEIAHTNRALAAISAVNRHLVYATDEDTLLHSICSAIVEQRGYRMASVAYAQQDKQKSIKVMAYAGHNEGYLESAQLSWAENEHGMGPSGRAIRSGMTQLCKDIANDHLYLPWRNAALQRGYASSIALPLADANGEIFGTLTVYAEEVNAFNLAEVDMLEELAGDLAFGVRTLRTRHERDLALEQSRRYLTQLQTSLEDTIQAISGIVELRDPYTAGHQTRVADLATAIARQMNLPDEQVLTIHLAGIVHDLGKIKIPAEILSKPGQLSEIEYLLIQTHPQAGYDILKDINFPWPIAQTVLQHHERLDGSGYPQGLKGDAIKLEARVLCVADVVEAMSSHRPYRPGLGIESALDEIVKKRGSSFDPDVVDACVALFKDHQFALKA
jgi:PAS domain S-box-containing protein